LGGIANFGQARVSVPQGIPLVARLGCRPDSMQEMQVENLLPASGAIRGSQQRSYGTPRGGLVAGWRARLAVGRRFLGRGAQFGNRDKDPMEHRAAGFGGWGGTRRAVEGSIAGRTARCENFGNDPLGDRNRATGPAIRCRPSGAM